MPAIYFHATCGHLELGTVQQNPATRRWEVWHGANCYAFRDAEDAATALLMLAQESPKVTTQQGDSNVSE